MLDIDKRQRLLTPWSLYVGQVLNGFISRIPVITEEQKDRIRPFFIIGSGRSGTTLLRRILLNHPAIDIPPETLGSLPNAIKKFFRYRGTDWSDVIGIISSEFFFRKNFELWETDIFPDMKMLINTPENDRSLAIIIDTVYKAHIRKHKPTADVWGDKSPFNTLRLKWINKTFPNSTFINIIRDGRDVCNSFVKAGLFSSLEESARRWNESVNQAYAFERKTSSGRYLNVKYEDLVTEPENEIKRVCDFLGKEYYSDMIHGTPEQMKDVHFYEHYANVQNEINADSVGQWKKLGLNDQKLLNKLLQKNLIRYNYKL